MEGRICSLAISPNLVYVGTVGGDVKVANREDGQLVEDRTWSQSNTPIEGIMYDYEGKVIYATEFNLVILDQNLGSKLKEIKSLEPLRKIFGLNNSLCNLMNSNDTSNWKKDDSYFRSQKSVLVGRKKNSIRSQLRHITH